MLFGCSEWPSKVANYYRETGCWKGDTFGDLLRQWAVKYGEKTAIVDGEYYMSYRELDTKADQLAAGWRNLGVKQGDKVVIQLPNITPFFEVCFALFRIGALPVFTLPSHRSSEITYICEYVEADAYVIAETHAGFDYRKLAEQVKTKVPSLKHVIVAGNPGPFIGLADLYQTPVSLPEVKAYDVAFFQLSGGSTGLPKLIPRTHDDYIYSLKASVEVCRLNKDSVYLAALPIAHNYPLSSPGVLGTLYAGGKVVLATGSSPDEAFPLIAKQRVTITGLVPPLALVWLEAAAARNADLSSLQVLQVGGAKFNPEVASRVKPVFDCVLQQVFGMAEGLVNYTRLDDTEDVIIHTQGRPMSEYDEICIVDDSDNEVQMGEIGHLLARGPYTIRGYYKDEVQNEKAFTSEGFYRTGDMVRMTSSGNLIVEGRAKDQINRGGEKISAEEVENHLLAHPSVHDASVVPMFDEFLGEKACAFIIKREMSLTTEELKLLLHERGMAAYKIPDQIEFIDSFPKTRLGKVSKKELQKLIKF
ncbi:2,3-dihydroxybenzoate-AMP ligase [Salibacterium salarium]|uniref:(2,3-dihydroxybenzoyl)adenylate synthase n=1 Tax=Salibacterium salarium TaxID=284579 RepID=UPI002789E534|nr:(2,3-dihydroxybenzoyl)adenylate synthase [Salibacterium salarium]MDQ0297939.1 2,3-dihydroxybenzoate-AMP ligase [Salibacterium salarium]